MSLVPKTLSRFAGRSVLKLRKNSPTIMVVVGIAGMGVTTVLAAKAGTKTLAVIEEHNNERDSIQSRSYFTDSNERNRAMLKLYTKTTLEFTKLYGPAAVLGAASAASILGGHNILKGRHIATMVAYSGLQERFNEYRGRVAQTLGEDREKDIHDGAHAQWVEDKDRPGEYNLTTKWASDHQSKYLRPFFDEYNANWTKSPTANYNFLMGVQQHCNHLLQSRGHLFLNEILDALRMERCQEGSIMGWVDNGDGGDGYVDFGFLTSNDPQTMAFRNGAEVSVQLNFNVDDTPIWNRI